MREIQTTIDGMLKSLVCEKKHLPQMTKTIYDPNCLSYCSDLCGVRCQNRCNSDHAACHRGILPDDFLFCPSANSLSGDLTVGFVSFESRDVETFGKGKPYKRMEKIVTDYDFDKFTQMMRIEFLKYGEHTLSYWFLRATKLEAFAASELRSATVTITSDFGEAIQIIGKHETADQFYHRPEVNYNILPIRDRNICYRCAYLDQCLRFVI